MHRAAGGILAPTYRQVLFTISLQLSLALHAIVWQFSGEITLHYIPFAPPRASFIARWLYIYEQLVNSYTEPTQLDPCALML